MIISVWFVPRRTDTRTSRRSWRSGLRHWSAKSADIPDSPWMVLTLCFASRESALLPRGRHHRRENLSGCGGDCPRIPIFGPHPRVAGLIAPRHFDNANIQPPWTNYAESCDDMSVDGIRSICTPYGVHQVRKEKARQEILTSLVSGRCDPRGASSPVPATVPWSSSALR